MADLPSSLALTTIADGSSLTASPVRTNFTAIQTAVNSLITGLSGGAANEFLQATDNDTVAWAGDYAAYTPALTAATSSPTLGTGSVASGRYLQVGKMVHAYGTLAFGTSGTAAGSGNYRVSLPVNAAASIAFAVVGQAWLEDDSASEYALPLARLDNLVATYFEMIYMATWPNGSAAAVTEAAPWAWAASDAIRWNILYEAA